MYVDSSDLRITGRPRRAIVGLDWPMTATFSVDDNIEAIGAVTFAGRKGELSAGGWTVGFVQAKWSDNSWGVYRGSTQEKGSVFVERSRPPARPFQACADTLTKGTPFYASAKDGAAVPKTGGAPVNYVASVPAGKPLPLVVQAFHFDQPHTLYECVRPNATTGWLNALREAQVESSYCAALAVRDPQGKLQMLRGFYWNIGWQIDLGAHPQSNPDAPTIPAGTYVHVGHVFKGPPTDPRFLPVLTQPQPVNCNQLLINEVTHPNVKEAAGWPLFDVRR